MPILQLLTEFKIFCDGKNCGELHRNKMSHFTTHRKVIKSALIREGWEVTTHKTICPDCKNKNKEK